MNNNLVEKFIIKYANVFRKYKLNIQVSNLDDCNCFHKITFTFENGIVLNAQFDKDKMYPYGISIDLDSTVNYGIPLIDLTYDGVTEEEFLTLLDRLSRLGTREVYEQYLSYFSLGTCEGRKAAILKRNEKELIKEGD